MDKPLEDLQYRSTRKKESLATLTDTQVGLYTEQREIHQFYAAQCMTYSKTSFTCLRTNCESYSSLKTVIAHRALRLKTDACRIF